MPSKRKQSHPPIHQVQKEQRQDAYKCGTIQAANQVVPMKRPLEEQAGYANQGAKVQACEKAISQPLLFLRAVASSGKDSFSDGASLQPRYVFDNSSLRHSHPLTAPKDHGPGNTVVVDLVSGDEGKENVRVQDAPQSQLSRWPRQMQIANQRHSPKPLQQPQTHPGKAFQQSIDYQRASVNTRNPIFSSGAPQVSTNKHGAPSAQNVQVSTRHGQGQVAPQSDRLTVSQQQHATISRTEPSRNRAHPGVASQLIPQPTSSELVLCKEQSQLVNLIMSGANVFFTGAAGCGKSTVLKAFVQKLRDVGKKVDIVAPTGRAALDINGSTTWTYAGWTPDSMKKPIEKLEQAAHGKFVHKRLKETDVLVIDEVSMIENWHLERLNRIMKASRGGERAFGGVQIIVTGDFCQLPPVKPFGHCMHCGRELAELRGGTVFKCYKHGEFQETDKWAFRSKAWEEAKFRHVNLTQVHRQKDSEFIKILQKIRTAKALTQQEKDLLNVHEPDTADAVKLFPTREEVARLNKAEFDQIQSRELVYSCLDQFKWNAEKHRHLESKGLRNLDGSLRGLNDHRYEAQFRLKVGMRVVLLFNLDLPAGLINGSQGVIVRLKRHEKSDLPKANPKESKAGEFEQGQRRLGEYAAMKEENIKAFIENASHKVWPVVRFKNGVERAIIADCTVNEVGDEQPYSLLSRTQIPLAPCWALSIHKAQGMTLDSVIVDLTRAFEEGQIYVALSRARSLQGLKVIGLDKFQNKANEQVKRFLLDKFGP